MVKGQIHFQTCELIGFLILFVKVGIETPAFVDVLGFSRRI